ncbi:MAG: hypothetical protein HY815_10515 [Candidatus Riflebacteria bacterium]|nr:hypothetical protein [Candidatus Riflebacteria bacterium]
MEATFPASLFRSGGGADLVWRLDLPARPGLPAGSTIQVELPPGIDASRIGSTGWRWQEVGRADPGGQRLIWRLRGDVPAPGSKPLIELHLPAGALPGARVVTLRGPGPYAITALFAILVVAAVGRALARSRRTGVEPALVAVLAILGGGAIFLLQPRLVEDNFSYQSYTRTALADLDLDLFDETYLYNATLAFTPDPREPIGPGGTAILLALPYAAAETFVRVARALAPPGPAGNGFSPPYVVAAALWSVLLAGVGATLIYAALRQLFDPVVSALAVLSGVLGTNLLMMCYMWTASTHLPSFVLVTSFFLLWHTTRERRSLTIWGLLGLLLGLAVQVRPQNVALVALPLWELVPTYWAIRGDDRRRGLAGLVVVFVFLVIGFSPQAVVWRAREGSAGLDLYGVSKGRFTGPLDRIIDMFVARPGRLAEPNGLLTAQPVLVPALLGLPLLAVRARRWTLELAFFLASQILIVASYEVWWGRVWYATPYLISCTLAFCLGLGATLEVLRRRVPVAVLAIVLLVAAGWNIRGAIVQQAHEQTALDVTEAAFVDLVGDLMEPPSPETTDHFKARGSDFAMIWRGLVDAWQERSPARALVLVGVIVGLLLSMVALARYLIARVEAASVRPLRVRRILVVLVAIVATAEVLLIVAARRTGPAVPCSRSWDRPSREIHLAYSALTPEQRNLKKSVKPDLPVQLIYLVTFLRDLRDAPQGLVVAELIATDLTGERWVFPVRAGLETAVHDRDLPGPSPSHGQARICHSWWNRDGSSVHYWGHAYGMVARLPSARRLASVELRFTADRGALIPLLFVYRGSSRPCLAPTDPDRPRDRDPDRSW